MLDGLHTTLLILQLHMPIVQKASPLRGYPRPSRPSVHPISSAQLNTKVKRSLKTRKGRK